MSQKMSVNLIVSREMTERGEDSVIRLPLAARNHLAGGQSTLTLGTESGQVEVVVKQALRTDLVRLMKMHQEGEVNNETLLCTGFVSKRTYGSLNRSGGEPHLWEESETPTIMVGCDPEFGLVHNNGILARGDEVLPGTEDAPFGADGPGVELRPTPSLNHLRVVEAMGKILKRPPRDATGFRWIGGATYRDRARTYWFGGHIHLGRPKGVPDHVAEQCYHALAKVLDHTLALPLLAFDTPEPHRRRNGCPHGYGKAGDIRLKDGVNRFEYRVPSGLWATHPVLATIVMGVAKAIAEDFYGRAKRMDYAPTFFTHSYRAAAKGVGYQLAPFTPVNQLINTAEAKVLNTETLEYWHRLIASLATREEYAEEIEALGELVKYAPEPVVNGLCLDLKENWLEGRDLVRAAPKTLKDAIKAVENKK